MDYFFCLVEFERDKNISGKTYWYKSSFLLNVGDEVIAPLNIRNKLQVGKVKKVVIEDDEIFISGAPFYLNNLKSIICKVGARRVKIPFSRDARDLGGLFYDEKHVTAYGNFIRGELPKGNLDKSGIDKIIYIGDKNVQFEGVDYEIFPPHSKNLNLRSSVLCVYGEENTGFSAAFSSVPLMGKIFKSALKREGTVMFCGDFGSAGADTAVAVLYLLCGVELSDIVKDRAISLKLLKGENQQSVNYADDEEFLSALKDFKKNYPDTGEYLKETGLREEEIFELERRMKSVSPRYI